MKSMWFGRNGVERKCITTVRITIGMGRMESSTPVVHKPVGSIWKRQSKGRLHLINSLLIELFLCKAFQFRPLMNLLDLMCFERMSTIKQDQTRQVGGTPYKIKQCMTSVDKLDKLLALNNLQLQPVDHCTNVGHYHCPLSMTASSRAPR